jgi:hypothetical protein
MNRREAVAVLSFTPLVSAQAKDSSLRKKFVGVWKLVSCESKNKTSGEARYPFGPNPVGRITYDQAGRMSALLMNPGRRPVGGSPARGSTAVIGEASCDEIREMVTGFIAYFGSFEIDESARTVIHHVQASLIPSWVGKDLRRTYEFSRANQLVLTATSDLGTTRLVWQRDAA